RTAHRSAALRQALYPWSVTTISSPDRRGKDARTALTPVVALATKTVRVGSEPTHSERRRRASARAGRYAAPKKRTGLASTRLRQSFCSSRTRIGVAPKDP